LKRNEFFKSSSLYLYLSISYSPSSTTYSLNRLLYTRLGLQIINPVAEPIYLDSLKAFTYPEIILQSAEWTVSGWMKFETLGTWPSEPRCRTVFVLSDSQ
jgi:hypothetical protein